MEESLKVDKDYLEAFNLGYELAKELNLKSSMFGELKSENSRLNAVQSGMAQYCDEIARMKSKARNTSSGMDIVKNDSSNQNPAKGTNRGEGLSI